MKIYSKFNDYYDSAMAHGVDDHLHWMRDVHEVELPLPKSVFSKSHYRDNEYPFFKTSIFKECPQPANPRKDPGKWSVSFIGVCGRIYPAYTYTIHTSITDHVSYTAYTAADIVRIMTDFKSALLPGFMQSSNIKTKRNHINETFDYKTVNTYLTKHSGSDQFDQYFTEHNVPVFIISTPVECNWNEINGIAVLYLNAQLGQYNFAKVMHSHTVYQKIEMYMSSILGLTEPDIVNIEDKYLAESKGFNKWSFKKMPTKHMNK